MRLIDADALLRRYDENHIGPPGAARKLIEDAPTIPYDMKWNDECEDCRPECIEDCIECRKRANQ